MTIRRTLALIAFLAAVPVAASAVPLQIAHQGELADGAGPVTDSVEVTFELFSAEAGGTAVWSEVRDVDVVEGHYAVLLGSSAQSDPIEDVLLQEPDLYLQLTIDGAPLLPRQQVGSTPYAIAAHTAENLSGGSVDASSLAVNGAEVVDSGGTWTGAAGSIPWSALDGVPSDADTLGGLSCADGLVAKWDAGSSLWACASDTVLTAAEVLAILTGAVVDLGAGSQVAGVGIATLNDLTWGGLDGIPPTLADGVDDDTILSSSDVLGMVDGATVGLGAGSQVAGVDIATLDDLTWGALDGIPPTLADGVDDDTVLSSSDVLGMVDGATVDLGTGSQVAGVDIATVDDLPAGITQSSVYLVQGSLIPACTSPNRVSKALCADANDVLLSGWCAYTEGSSGWNVAQGPIDSTSAECPTINDFQNYASTAGGPFGAGPLGWGCREGGNVANLPAYALCLTVP